VRAIKDAGARMLMLAGTSADLTQNTVRVDLVDILIEDPRLHAVMGPSVILTYMMFNNRDPIVGDARVRRALAHAIDREAVVAAKFGGHAVLATGLLAPMHWAYAGDVPRYPYDPARARALLDDAGWPDPEGPAPRFTLTYKTSADAFRVSVAHVLAQQLEAVGVAVEVRAFEFGTFFADIKAGNYQIATMQTSEIVDPDLYTYYFHSTRIPSKEFPDHGNRWRYRNTALDAVIDDARVEPDRARRVARYAEAQRILATDLPVIPLWHEDNIAVMNRDVTGYQVIPSARLARLVGTAKAPR
jgi:peptide/nickel transport system substrate-binding protein